MAVEEPYLSRRDLTISIATGAAGFLAGCGSSSDSAGPATPEPDVQVVEPKIRSQIINRWEQTNEQFVKWPDRWGTTTYEKRLLFENTQLRKQVRKRTLGQFDATLAMFFASHLDLRGLTTIGATPGEIANELSKFFKDEMEAAGVNDVESVELGRQTPQQNDPSETKEFRGTFPVERIEKSVNIDGIGERRIEIPTGDVEITGLFSVWKPDNGHAFAAGGAFPAEPYAKSDTMSITGNEGQGIDLNVSIDLDLGSHRLRGDVIDLIESVR